jgi:hypothetical protein
MGNSTWTAPSNRAAYASTTALYATKSTREEIFTQRNVHAMFSPSNIKVRESCDSVANPNSTPIILGLDVTGSMGFIAEYIARKGLGPLIERIFDTQAVSDPHLMVMAVGDIFSDSAPLQASQFEADIRIVEQLTQLWLEGRGGGNGFESYDLPWLFAALKTKTDSYDKRGKKGYLFTIGDEPPPPPNTIVSKMKLDALFGKGTVEKDYKTSEMLELAMKKWAVFHIVVEEGNHASRYLNATVNEWVSLFGEVGNGANVICLNDHTKIAEVVTAVLRVAEGADIDDVIMESGDAKAAVQHAFGRVLER